MAAMPVFPSHAPPPSLSPSSLLVRGPWLTTRACSSRLVDAALRPGGLAASEEAVKVIPGPHFSFDQSVDEGGASGMGDGVDSGEERRTVLVVFIGGITFAEISALRFMSSQGGLNCNFVIMTTKMINGNSLVRSLCTDFAT